MDGSEAVVLVPVPVVVVEGAEVVLCALVLELDAATISHVCVGVYASSVLDVVGVASDPGSAVLFAVLVSLVEGAVYVVTWDPVIPGVEVTDRRVSPPASAGSPLGLLDGSAGSEETDWVVPAETPTFVVLVAAEEGVISSPTPLMIAADVDESGAAAEVTTLEGTDQGGLEACAMVVEDADRGESSSGDELNGADHGEVVEAASEKADAAPALSVNEVTEAVGPGAAIGKADVEGAGDTSSVVDEELGVQASPVRLEMMGADQALDDAGSAKSVELGVTCGKELSWLTGGVSDIEPGKAGELDGDPFAEFKPESLAAV